MRVYDTSSERKTAERLLCMTLEVKALLEADWQVEVITLTSDASGKSRKGRMDLVKAVPSLVGPDCYSHQVYANYPTQQLYMLTITYCCRSISLLAITLGVGIH